jgi:glycosyltransferase involved in cell wall biosynthesis
LGARGHQVFVALRAGAAWRGELGKILAADKQLLLPLTNAVDVQSAWQLADFIRRERIEIVHAHLARDYSLAALAVRLSRMRAKLVLTRHVLFPINRLHKFLLPRETVFIAVSGAVQNQLLEQRIVSAESVKLVYNGIDTRRFADVRRTFDRRTFLEKLELSPDRRYVGIVGEITPHKGQIDFVRAAALVAEKHLDVDFLIVGRDSAAGEEHLAELKKLIDELDLTARVKLLGWFDDVAEILCAFDVFVSASRVEPFGLVIVEAMAAGLPVVATKSEGAQEILNEGETGKLVSIGDAQNIANAVSFFLENKEAAQTTGRRAEIAARENFDLARMITETEKVYADLIKLTTNS